MARFRSWWQKIRKPLEIAVVITLPVIVIVLFVLIVLGYILHWDWTGLNGYTNVLTATEITASPQKITKTITYQPGKTLWDWLQLLIIPAVLAVGGYLFNYTASRNEQKSTQLRDQTERDIAAGNQRENALQAYLDKMSELLLVNNLRNSSEDAEVRKIARVRTLTVLRRLDAERKGNVLRFLHESGLIDKDKCIIDLSDADLSDADLSRANLSLANLGGADLSDANLSDANLSGADLRRVNLSWALLSDANLSDANLNAANLKEAGLSGAGLSGANLRRANLSGADLSIANLVAANLSGADLDGADLNFASLSDAKLILANLKEADLSEADLSGANLRVADLRRANLSKANLGGANLSGARGTTPEQLDKALSLKDTIMPEGSKHA